MAVPESSLGCRLSQSERGEERRFSINIQTCKIDSLSEMGLHFHTICLERLLVHHEKVPSQQ